MALTPFRFVRARHPTDVHTLARFGANKKPNSGRGFLPERVTELWKGHRNNYEGLLPPALDDQIARRLATVPAYERTFGAGSHAEVYAVNELLMARPGAVLSDIAVYTMETGTARFLYEFKPPCVQCEHLLRGVYFLR